MSRNRKMDFAAGIQDGIPICLGYIAVSFTFGIMAKNAGLSTWEAVLISLTNLTSAGQFAGLSLITASASYFEMAFTQLIINLRYSLMSCALSQKIDNHYPFFHRFLIAYGVTDEVFGVSVSRPGRITPWYSGFRIIILTILIAGIAAYFFPVKEETNPEDKDDSSVEA